MMTPILRGRHFTEQKILISKKKCKMGENYVNIATNYTLSFLIKSLIVYQKKQTTQILQLKHDKKSRQITQIT